MFYSVTDWSSFGIYIICYLAILTYTCYLLEGLCFILYDKTRCTKNNSACICRLPLSCINICQQLQRESICLGNIFPCKCEEC